MFFIALHLSILLIPGWLVVSSIGHKENRYLISVALSYAFFLLLSSVGRSLDWSPTELAYAYLLSIAVLGSCAYARHRLKSVDTHVLIENTLSQKGDYFIGLVIVVLAYLLYRQWAGHYTEVPADLYNHLEYIRSHILKLDRMSLGSDRRFIHLLEQKGHFWYLMLAWMSHISGQEMIDIFESAMMVNELLFLIAVYFFSRALFHPLKLTVGQHQSAALLAVFFVFSQMGINAFSYFRYYSIGPTILNYIIYFAGVACVLSAYLGNRQKFIHFVLFVICLLAAVMIHTQEGMFIIVMTVLTVGFYEAQKLFLTQHIARWEKYKAISVLSVLFLGSIALWVFAWQTMNRAELSHDRIIYLSETVPVLNRLLILNPAFQFYEVITIWGVWIYGLFFVFLKKFKSQPFLLAGMMSPLFTVFNPLFVDLFLRFDDATTLWRVAYLMPLHFVAALVVVWLYGATKMALLDKKVIIKKVAAGLSIGLCFILLLPGLGPFTINAYAKRSLAPVAENNSYHQWRDLLDFLNSQTKGYRILTDPSTGYVVAALTRQKTFRKKFHGRSIAYQSHLFIFDDYDDFPLREYGGWLFVLNERNGANSQMGDIAGHWPTNVLNVSQHYTEPLKQHLANNPDHFTEIWSQGRIKVYKINNL